MASILLVDDDEQLRTMLSEVLRRAGHQVREASDGNQGLRLYEIQPSDLIITDLVMPGEEGLGMIRKLKRLHPEVKIIAISGGGRIGPLSKQDYLKMARMLGAQIVLTKPFSNQEILDAVNNMLQAK